MTWVHAGRFIVPRILARCVPTPGPLETPCWVWQGYAYKGRYGRCTIWQRQWYVHRVMWMLGAWSYVPPDYEVHHRCEVTRCCNPEHLECVHASVNKQQRDIAFGRRAGGFG